MRIRLIRYAVPVIFSAIVTLSASASNAQMGAIAAVDEPASRSSAAEGGGSVTSGKATGTSPQETSHRRPRTSAARARSAAKPSTASVAARQKKASAKYDGFVIGDKYTFMNFEVIKGDKPYHTRVAKEAGATGLVQVEILIDEDGSVLSAKGRTGNKLLWPEAERAALSSRFNRPYVYGKPARAIGFLVYSFGKVNESDDN